MVKFDYMKFLEGSKNVVIVNAKKYSKEEAIELVKDETAYDGPLTCNDVLEQWCKYCVQTPEWCSYENGCYFFCEKEEKGAFPVWIIVY